MSDGFNVGGNMNFGGVQVSGFQSVNGQITASWGNHQLSSFSPQNTFVAHQHFTQPTHVYKQISQFGVTQHQPSTTYMTEQRPVHVHRQTASPQQLSELKQVLVERGYSKFKANKMIKAWNTQFKYEPDKLTAQVWNTGFKNSAKQKMYEHAKTELSGKGYTPIQADARAQMMVKKFKTDSKKMNAALDLMRDTPAKKAKDELRKNFHWAVGEFQKLGYSPERSTPFIINAQRQHLHNPEAFKQWVRNAPPPRPATPPPSQPMAQPAARPSPQSTRRQAPEPPRTQTSQPVSTPATNTLKKTTVPPFPKPRDPNVSKEQYLQEEFKPWAKQLFENQGRSPKMADKLADEMIATMSAKAPDLSVVPVKPSELSIAESKKKDEAALNLLFLDPTATSNDVNKAFRKMAILHHPDASHGKNLDQEQVAKFNAISNAKDHLLNSKTFPGANR